MSSENAMSEQTQDDWLIETPYSEVDIQRFLDNLENRKDCRGYFRPVVPKGSEQDPESRREAENELVQINPSAFVETTDEELSQGIKFGIGSPESSALSLLQRGETPETRPRQVGQPHKFLRLVESDTGRVRKEFQVIDEPSFGPNGEVKFVGHIVYLFNF